MVLSRVPPSARRALLEQKCEKKGKLMIIEMKQNTILNLQPLHQCVPVTFHYDIHFTTGLFQLDNPLVGKQLLCCESLWTRIG